MIKRFFLLIASVAVTVCVALAQHAPGSWKVFPMSAEYYDQVLETSKKVYYITGGSLYSYDKEWNETIYYAPGTRLSDSGIKSIHYNDEGKYLLVIYTSGNLDLIYEDGAIVNMPEIKNANITSSKNINGVDFSNGYIYLATDFGFVIIDDKNHVVKESAMLGRGLDVIMANKDNIFTVIDNRFCYSPVGDRHNSIDKFKPLTDHISMTRVMKIDDHNFIQIYSTGDNTVLYKLTENAPVSASFTKVAATPNLSTLFRYKDGFIAIYGNTFKNESGYTDYNLNKMAILDKNGDFVKTVTLPDELSMHNAIGTWNGLSAVWAADNAGLGCFDLSGETPVVLSERFRPQSSEQFAAGFVIPSPDGASVYVTRMGMSECHPGGDANWSQHLPFICERYDWSTGLFTPVYPYGVRNTSKESRVEADMRHSQYYYGGPGTTLIDPVDPDLIYHANNFEGLVLIKDRKVLHELNSSVIPVKFTWGSRVECLEFDQMGNLWIGCWNYSNTRGFTVLPKTAVDKLRNDPSSITSSDFVSPAAWPVSENGKMDMRLLAVPGTTKMFYFRGGWSGPIIGYDNKGTTSFTDDASSVYTGFVDQDGTVTSPNFRCSMALDHNNHIWVGTTGGVYVVKDLDQLGTSTSSNLNVVRPKVSRNDGTNYADYLLTSETVLSIAVDPSNRKWLATQASGLYLVSEDGTEILEQFTKDNSPLMSNTVYMVTCDPSSNDVLIGTPEGMFLYSSTSAPAADNYSDVYAFPNPVRPDYTGWITINGLMDNSLVKIADMQGNIFWEGKSEGGMVVWDGCNRDGSRVRSGVYLVFASSFDGTNSDGAVAKIVVIN